MMHHSTEQNFLVHNFNPAVQVPQRQQHHHQFALSPNDGFGSNVPTQHGYPTSHPYSLAGGNYVNSSSSTQLLKPVSSTIGSYHTSNTYTTCSDFTITPISQVLNVSTLEHQFKRNESDNLGKLVSHDDRESSSEDEDVHQCGRCKQLFNSLKEYIAHKSSKVCKTKTNKPVVTSPVIPIDNQNILEAAAKNTIFRDAFMLDAPSVVDGVEEVTKEGNSNKSQKTMESRSEDSGDGKTLVDLKLMKEDSNDLDLNKKRRGRPPKIFDPEDESLKKAKRKSRPPRRLKHDDDLNDLADEQDQEQLHGSQLPQDEHGNVLLSALDPSGLPTVENIQKYFAGSRGRGRGRNRAPLHRCPICQLLFPNRPTMLEHKRKHTKVFKCKICNEGFYTEDKLEKHMTRETHTYNCDECDRILTNKQALIRHKLSHTDKLHKCDECSRSFKTERDLKNHKIGMHSERKDFVCEVCQKGFTRREKLKRHLMIHAPDRPIYTCPFKNHVGCDKTFYRKDKLTRHLYSHSKVKPFKCDQCDKSFARTDNLREHIRSHTGVFRYYCTVCGKGQPGPKKFLQHMFKQHNVDNAEIPKPFDELAPEPLIQQHKAVVQAESAARLARAASNMKKERDKTQKLRKEDLEDITVDPSQQHVTLAAMNSLGLQSTLLSSPTQAVSSEQVLSRSNIEALYSINQHTVASPFQLARHIPETMVRQINENIMRERENALRDNLEQQTITRQMVDGTDATLTRHQLVESSRLSVTNEEIRRQMADASSASESEHVTQDHQATHQSDQQQTQASQQTQVLHTALGVEDGGIPVSRGSLHLLSQGVLPGSLQFTTLLNSDLVAIGEAVIRNQNGIPTIFQQKYVNQ